VLIQTVEHKAARSNGAAVQGTAAGAVQGTAAGAVQGTAAGAVQGTAADCVGDDRATGRTKLWMTRQLQHWTSKRAR